MLCLIYHSSFIVQPFIVAIQPQLASIAVQVVKFSNGGYKIKKIFGPESTFSKESLNFENWVNGEVSNIGHLFRKFEN